MNENIYIWALFGVFVGFLYLSCAPPGYIDHESACEREVEQLKEELKAKATPYPEEVLESGDMGE